MAQTTIPVYLTGKVGSIVYTPNRQGTDVRQLVTPKNPATPGQTAARQRFATAGRAWAGLAAAAQATWKTFAKTLANNLSSFNAFVRVNITCQEIGTTPPTNALGSVGIVPVSFTGTPPLTAGLASGGAHPRYSASASWKWYYLSPSAPPPRATCPAHPHPKYCKMWRGISPAGLGGVPPPTKN